MAVRCFICVAIILISFFEIVLSMSGGFYADDARQQTVMFKPFSKKERNNLQREILHVLGLEHRPKPRHVHPDSHSSAQNYLLDVYRSFKDRDEDKQDEESRDRKQNKRRKKTRKIMESDFIVSLVNRNDKLHKYPHLRHERDKRYWFDVSEVSRDDEIVFAEMRIYRNVSRRIFKKHVKYVLNLYSVEEGTPNANTLKPVDKISVAGRAGGWLDFNVTAAAVNWISLRKKNLGLYMQIKEEGSSHTLDPHEIGLSCSRGSEEYQPFMVVYFKSNDKPRVRRSTKSQKEDRYYDHDNYNNPYSGYGRDRYHSKRNCQKWTLYVSFRDLGWEDWIIAPDGYAAFYCQGECSFPLNAHMNATNHAIVQTLVHLMDPSVVPKPCCAPTQLSPITVLYFDDNSNVILKNYKNMVVKSCGCH